VLEAAKAAGKGDVTLDANLECVGAECGIDTLKVINLDGAYYEYVRVPCVEQAFFADGHPVTNEWLTHGKRFAQILARDRRPTHMTPHRLLRIWKPAARNCRLLLYKRLAVRDQLRRVLLHRREDHLGHRRSAVRGRRQRRVRRGSQVSQPRG
jgi:hypothetical protein